MQVPQISNSILNECFRVEVLNHGLEPNYTWIENTR